MEPRREEQSKAPAPGTARKAKNFRIIKLEERIAPIKGGSGSNNCTEVGCATYTCLSVCTASQIRCSNTW